MKTKIAAALLATIVTVAHADDEYLGQLSANPYDPDSVNNPYGAGNPYKPDSVTNPYGRYGNPTSPNSVSNPYATETPKLYDSQGNYRGKLSSNPYDPESVSNPYGRYGNPYSADSVNNPYGAGNPYSQDGPTNPFGKGLGIYAGDGKPGESQRPADAVDDLGDPGWRLPELQQQEDWTGDWSDDD